MSSKDEAFPVEPVGEGSSPAEPEAPRAELVSQLRDLRRDVAEAQTVAIRTGNAVTTLAASLKEVVQRQSRYDSGLNLNSFVAYVIFTALLGGGFYMLYDTRAARLVDERNQAIRQRQQAVDEAAEARQELAARDAAQRKALDYWQLLASGRREEAIAKYGEITHERLTPVEQQVFQLSVTKARAEIVDGGYAEGLEAFQQQQWKRASAAFKKALSYEDEGPRAAQMRYYHGAALAKLGDKAETARPLELAIAGGVERSVGPDARFLLGGCYEALRQYERARVEYDKFATGHPQHGLAGVARRKNAELAAKATP
jgi:TolA-binding protein